jgi:hypothetical protein
MPSGMVFILFELTLRKCSVATIVEVSVVTDVEAEICLIGATSLRAL